MSPARLPIDRHMPEFVPWPVSSGKHTFVAERRGHEGRVAGAAAVVIFLYALFIASLSTLFDRDEPRFAQAAVEMLEGGTTLYPTFNHELRPDKPILVYWLMAASMSVFGPSGLAARLVSPICLALTCWFTFQIGRRLYGARVGLLAMGLLAVSPLALVEGVVATTDALLLACLTLVLLGFSAMLLGEMRLRNDVLVVFGTAGAMLAKGPVGLAIPLFSIAITLWIVRREAGVRTLAIRIAIALLLAVALFLGWAVPANAATGGEFAARGLGHHVVDRALTPLEGHGGGWLVSLPFYVPVLIVGMLPLAAYLPAAIVRVAPPPAGERAASAILSGWTAATFVLMTVVSTKLFHYVLPLAPAVAIACAAVACAPQRGEGDTRDRLHGGGWVFAGIAASLVVALIALPTWSGYRDWAWPMCAFALTLAGTAFLTMRSLRRGQAVRAAHVSIFGFACAWLTGAVLLLPRIEETKISPKLATAIRAATDRSVPVARWKFVEPSLDFALNRPPIRDFDDELALREWANTETPAVLVIPRRELLRLRDVLPASRYTEIAAVMGLNLSKGVRTEVVALMRSGSPPPDQERAR